MASRIDLYSLLARSSATQTLTEANGPRYLCSDLKGFRAYKSIEESATCGSPKINMISVLNCTTGEVLMLTENQSLGLMHFDRGNNKMEVDVVDVNGDGYKNTKDKGSIENFDKMQALAQRVRRFFQK